MEDRFKFRIKFVQDNRIRIEDVLMIDFKTRMYFFEKDGITYNIGFANAELLQCTGLHDSTKWEQLTKSEKYNFCKQISTKDWKYQNVEDVKPLWKGKLIYQKDILLSDDFDTPYMIIVDWDNENACFYIAAWNGKEFECGLSDDEMEDLKTFEIIGNIYETPELLEGKE